MCSFTCIWLKPCVRNTAKSLCNFHPNTSSGRDRPIFLKGRLAGNPSNRKQIVSKCRIRHLKNLGMKILCFHLLHTYSYDIYRLNMPATNKRSKTQTTSSLLEDVAATSCVCQISLFKVMLRHWRKNSSWKSNLPTPQCHPPAPANS